MPRQTQSPPTLAIAGRLAALDTLTPSRCGTHLKIWAVLVSASPEDLQLSTPLLGEMALHVVSRRRPLGVFDDAEPLLLGKAGPRPAVAPPMPAVALSSLWRSRHMKLQQLGRQARGPATCARCSCASRCTTLSRHLSPTCRGGDCRRRARGWRSGDVISCSEWSASDTLDAAAAAVEAALSEESSAQTAALMTPTTPPVRGDGRGRGGLRHCAGFRHARRHVAHA